MKNNIQVLVKSMSRFSDFINISYGLGNWIYTNGLIITFGKMQQFYAIHSIYHLLQRDDRKVYQNFSNLPLSEYVEPNGIGHKTCCSLAITPLS
jgi:hypothetical protein